MEFSDKTKSSASLNIDEPDFSIEFGQKKKAWKYAVNQAPTCLRNKLAGYPVSELALKEYSQTLEVSLDNGWLIPYLDEKIRSLKSLVPLMSVIQECIKWYVPVRK